LEMLQERFRYSKRSWKCCKNVLDTPNVLGNAARTF
jgi:hypothetical protein